MEGGYFPILRDRVRPREFNSLFLFVTSRCNARCRTCFYFDKLNSRDDLTFDQIARISETAPPFRKLWISGGEPFLRDELAEIITLFVRRNGVRNVNLPTNGLLPEKMFPAVDRMLEQCPETAIDLNFSLDGLEHTHDSIRGVPRNFERTLAAMQEAGERYGGNPRLRRNVLTVITRENRDEVEALAARLAETTGIDGHYFETIRGQAPDPSLKQLTRESVAALHSRLMPFHRRYAKKLVRPSRSGCSPAGGALVPGQSPLPLRPARAVPGIAEGLAHALHSRRDHHRNRPQRPLPRVRDARYRGRPARFRFRHPARPGFGRDARRSRCDSRGELLVYAQLLHPGQLEILSRRATLENPAGRVARQIAKTR